MKVKVIKIAINANGINAGENTHHQDQLITLHSFNTTNTINNTSRKLTPPLLTVILSVTFIFVCRLINANIVIFVYIFTHGSGKRTFNNKKDR